MNKQKNKRHYPKISLRKMQIIPVVDVQNGHAVHAREGKRSSYLPINTPLCQSNEVVEVVNCFKSLYDFSIIYIADLNAIMNEGNNDAVLLSLLESFPETTFWMDQGLASVRKHKQALANFMPVLGSECMQRQHLQPLTKLTKKFVLSLDHLAADKLGPKVLFSEAKYWPENIIIMTMGRVGSSTGPDFARLNYYYNHYPQQNFIAAGGIRNCDDLFKLEQTGVKQALVASALHNQQIKAEDITQLQRV